MGHNSTALSAAATFLTAAGSSGIQIVLLSFLYDNGVIKGRVCRKCKVCQQAACVTSVMSTADNVASCAFRAAHQPGDRSRPSASFFAVTSRGSLTTMVQRRPVTEVHAERR